MNATLFDLIPDEPTKTRGKLEIPPLPKSYNGDGDTARKPRKKKKMYMQYFKRDEVDDRLADEAFMNKAKQRVLELLHETEDGFDKQVYQLMLTHFVGFQLWEKEIVDEGLSAE